ncbi:hypothetical protein [Polyangium spumosum]|uniref:Serine protease n=1 Tax=Polyangium spumosum TaxID=889282 RepID=A0A6N7Q3L0_9BACT|nr:hypothetical protein [Polyangium spumosum]MRG95491.1 hypothetical protein [Polyangium spumosum]
MKTIAMTLMVAAACGVAAPVHAQPTVRPQEAPGLGGVTTSVGTAAGSRLASDLRSGCNGYIPVEHDFNVEITERRASMLLYTRSDKDLVLVVKLPDGSYRCDDDSGGASQPQIQITNPPLGTYRVWIGVFNPGDVADFKFHTAVRPILSGFTP